MGRCCLQPPIFWQSEVSGLSEVGAQPVSQQLLAAVSSAVQLHESCSVIRDFPPDGITGAGQLGPSPFLAGGAALEGQILQCKSLLM